VPVKRTLTGTAHQEAAARYTLAEPDSLEVFVELATRRDRRTDPTT
jgi:hypothetical protein